MSLQQGDGDEEGVDKGRKGGVLSEQEKWKWNESLEYLKRKFGDSELLADGTTEEDTLLWEVGELENFQTLFFKLNQLNHLYWCLFVLSLCLHTISFKCQVLIPPLSLILLWLLKLCPHILLIKSSFIACKTACGCSIVCLLCFKESSGALIKGLKYRWQTESLSKSSLVFTTASFLSSSYFSGFLKPLR